MMAYFLDGQKLFKPNLHVGNIDRVDICCLEKKLQILLKGRASHQETVSFANCVFLHGTQYTKDMLISAGELSGLPEFYRILNIWVDTEKVLFVAGKFSSWYMEHYRSYQLDSCYTELALLSPEDLNDYHPLTGYTVAGKLIVTPIMCLLH